MTTKIRVVVAQEKAESPERWQWGMDGSQLDWHLLRGRSHFHKLQEIYEDIAAGISQRVGEDENPTRNDQRTQHTVM